MQQTAEEAKKRICRSPKRVLLIGSSGSSGRDTIHNYSLGDTPGDSPLYTKLQHLSIRWQATNTSVKIRGGQ